MLRSEPVDDGRGHHKGDGNGDDELPRSCHEARCIARVRTFAAWREIAFNAGLVTERDRRVRLTAWPKLFDSTRPRNTS